MPDWKPSFSKTLLCDVSLIQHYQINNLLRKKKVFLHQPCLRMFQKQIVVFRIGRNLKLSKERDFYFSLLSMVGFYS